jgi:hypothetical protein
MAKILRKGFNSGTMFKLNFKDQNAFDGHYRTDISEKATPKVVQQKSPCRKLQGLLTQKI